ncbi:GNAT family N-acetyltransferase [Microbulbifer sp. 2304DJ12-6]|uniref:GNAT family N-acetyltransferase n=1 Tax=Microbulbifer sp. 2304DJ12-6 TaxID=3233340 RepID=UPI0039B0DC05
MTSPVIMAGFPTVHRGALDDGRRWCALETGYRCELHAGVFAQVAYIAGEECAGISIPTGNVQMPDLNHWLDWLFSLNPALQRIEVLMAGKVPHTAGSEITRVDFYQRASVWYRGNNGGSFPLQWVENHVGLRHPLRPEPVDGEVYRRHFYSLGMDFSLRSLDPESDLMLFTGWMNQRRVARFWQEEGDCDKQKRYIETVIQDPHKYPLMACFDDMPFGYFEVYWAYEDRIAPHCDAQLFDRGAHLLVGDRRFLGSQFTRAWFNGVSHFLFLDDSRTQTLVGEPRADHVAMLRYFDGMFGWQKIREFEFPHKRAALVLCQRGRFFQSMGGV